jgi:hypothetical protein
MLLREDNGAAIVITQPAHAWLSGQMARAWGNERFGEVVPWEEVCLAAEQHDIGHVPLELAPALHPNTGRPITFLDMPRRMHVGLWSGAGRQVLPQNRYAALFVSLHGTGLYESYDARGDSPDDADAVRAFLANERAFQEELLAGLRASNYAPHATPEAVARNRRLIQIWDALSLALCFGLRKPRAFPDVPTAAEPAGLQLTPLAHGTSQIRVAPWPFRWPRVTLTCEGRRLSGTWDDQDEMRRALAQAPWVSLPMTLLPDEA